MRILHRLKVRGAVFQKVAVRESHFQLTPIFRVFRFELPIESANDAEKSQNEVSKQRKRVWKSLNTKRTLF